MERSKAKIYILWILIVLVVIFIAIFLINKIDTTKNIANEYDNDLLVVDEPVLEATPTPLNTNTIKPTSTPTPAPTEVPPVQIMWDKAESSSYLKDKRSNYSSDMLIDNDNSTTWTEGVKGSGEGEWIKLTSNFEIELESIQVINGYNKSEKSFTENNRVKKVLLEFDDGTSEVLELNDGFGLQEAYELPKIKTNSVKITIQDTYKGDTYDDTCMSEIIVLGKQNKDIKRNDLVNIKDIDDSIVVDLKYATTDNFTGQKIYATNDCLLRRGTANKLAKANEAFKRAGYKIKIYDGFRPLEAQKTFWEILPDRRYVALPSKGSRHNRGASVDITLVDDNGNEINMPSSFDDFSEKSSRTFNESLELEKQNLEYLTKIMVANGFSTIDTEWWHFDDTDWEDYEIE